MPNVRRNRNRGEFTSSEPISTPARNEGQRDMQTGRRIGRTIQIDTEHASRLQKYSDLFHDLHSGPRAGSKINPLFDLRKDPMTRFSDYLDSAWNEHSNDQDALAYAEKVFSDQGDNIAGNWKYQNEVV